MGAHARSVARVVQLVEQLGVGPWTREAVLDAGWTPAQIRRAVDAGRLLRPQRGVLAAPLPAAGSPGAPVALTHDQLIAAALLTAPSGAIVSHWSAAELHGLWTPRRLDGHVHLTVPGDHDDVDHGVRRHGSALPQAFVVRRGPTRLTSVARTAVDVARGQRFPDALMTLDSAARILAGATDPADLRDLERRDAARRGVRELWAAYGSVRSWPGSVAVREAIPHLDPGSESAFESTSRGWLILDGLPPPKVGADLLGASGARYFGDFVWEGPRVVGEADGLGKYGRTDREVRAALVAERRRQFDLEEAGWRFVRWDPRERALSWLRRLRAALASPS
jgi:hypothetical protein